MVIDNCADATVTGFSSFGLSESTAAQAGSMIGGGRFEGLLCFFACDYNPPYSAALTVGRGALIVKPPPAGLATTRILWGNVSTGGVFPFAPLGLMLTGEDAFQLQLGAVSGDLLVQFVVVSAAGLSIYSPLPNNPGVVLRAAAVQTLTPPFSAFVGQAGWADVSGLGVVLGGNNGHGTEAALASFTLTSVTAVTAVTAVPEPGSSVLLPAGLLAVASARWRRRR